MGVLRYHFRTVRLWQVCCGPCWRSRWCVVKTLYAWACFMYVTRNSLVPVFLLVVHGTDEVKNFQLGWAMFAIQDSWHQFTSLNWQVSYTLCWWGDVLWKLSACMGARALSLLHGKSCSRIPSRMHELQTFNLDGRASVFKSHNISSRTRSKSTVRVITEVITMSLFEVES